MKKQSKIVLVVVALLAIVGIFGFGTQMTFNGGTILSIDNAKFLTNSPDAQGENAFLIEVAVNRGGESLVGEITPDDLKSYGLTQIPSGPFKVFFNLKNVSCNYDIIADDLTIYKIYQATVKGANVDSTSGCPWNSVDLNSVKSACKGTWSAARGTETASPGAPVAGGNCDSIVDIQSSAIRPELGMQPGEWCYAQLADQTGGQVHWRTAHIGGIPFLTGYKIGDVASPQFQVEIIVENSNGSRVTTTLSNKETAKFLLDVGKASWVGNLQAQQMCGVPSVEKAVVRDLNTNTMKVIKRNFYEDYKSKLFELVNYDNNEFAFQFNAPVPPRDPGVGAGVLTEKMSTLNRLFTNIYATSINDNCQIVGMQYVCTPTQDVIYPQLRLILKASWIGIVIPNGKPRILDVTLPGKIYDGEASFVKVDIENIGKEVDSFDLAMDCGNEISLGSVRVSLDAGEKDYVNLNFVADVGTYQCKAIMYSVNNPMARDEKEFFLTILERDIPKPNSCEEKDIPEPPCGKALWQADPFCEWNTQFCDETKKDYSIYYWISGALVATLIVMYFLSRKNSGSRRRRKK
jgi:hypothetical protein